MSCDCQLSVCENKKMADISYTVSGKRNTFSTVSPFTRHNCLFLVKVEVFVKDDIAINSNAVIG